MNIIKKEKLTLVARVAVLFIHTQEPVYGSSEELFDTPEDPDLNPHSKASRMQHAFGRVNYYLMSYVKKNTSEKRNLRYSGVKK